MFSAAEGDHAVGVGPERIEAHGTVKDLGVSVG